MKFFNLTLLTFFSLQIPAFVFPQEITLTVRNAKLEAVFDEISKQTGVDFLYDGRYLSKSMPVSVTLTRASLLESLDQIFTRQPFAYEISDDAVVIRLKDDNEEILGSNYAAHELLPAGEVRGKVTNSLGVPLAAATIRVEGTHLHIVTDQQGAFIFSNVPDNAILEISYVGFLSKKIRASADIGTVVLLEDENDLDEVVVVGYGKQNRRDLTGAISSVSKKHLEYNTATSVDVLLGGAVAGVNVTQGSGQPGAPATIRIRGGNSVTASNNPLYVIDGFLFFSDNASTKTGFGGIDGDFNPLNLLNPSDIFSIDILKDVSATAIYGSRGSNGVILVTTKRGSKGRSSIDYQYSLGVATSAKKLDLLNAAQWARLQKDYFLNKPGYSDAEIAQLGDGYDWQHEILQTGITQNHALSISGGDDKSQYFLSGNHLAQEGVVLHSGLDRFVGRVNYIREVYPGFEIGISLTGNKSTQNSLTTFEEVNYNSSPYSAGIANSLTYALYMPPVVPFYADNGEYNYNNPFEYAYLRQGTKTANPISDLVNSTAQTMYTALLGNFYAQYKPLDGVTAKVSIGSNLAHAAQKYFSPSYTALGLEPNGVGGIGNKRSEILLSEFTLSYKKKLNAAQYFDALGGFTFQDTKTNFVSTLSSDFTNEDLGVDNLQDGTPYGSKPIFSGTTESKLYSLLGRINYSLYDRYHVTANFRSDYSTRFAKDHKWGIFPSIGIAWNISDEHFLKDNKNLSSLKLRASAGSVGNQEIGDYEYLQFLEATHYGGEVAYRVGNSGNENLKWETTSQYNAGVDAGFLDNRIQATADVYYKETSDLLLLIPPSLGNENEQLVNVGNLTNRGIEFSVNAIAIHNQTIQWSISANMAHNTNRITKLFNDAWEKLLGVEILRIGEPLGSFYGLQFDGVVQKNEDVSALPKSPSNTTLVPGDPKFRDSNRDGYVNVDDRQVLGNKQPSLTYGLSSSLNYRGFDLFVLLQGTQGNSVYNQLRRYLERPTDAYNTSAVLLQSWTELNPSNTVPRITNVPLSSELDSRYIEDASYLRLKTVTIGYTIGKASSILRNLPLRIRFFTTAQNLLTVTGYKGYDPEISKGIDLGSYPMPRTFLSGVNVSF